MCQIEPFVLPCCNHVYVNIKRTPSCPAEWPRKKCPADLCIQVRAFEPEYKPEGKCWRCRGKDEGLTKKETDDKYTPSIDRAEVVMGLEEVTAKERRAHAEHWGNCWFCHSSGDCQRCGARKIGSYTPLSSPKSTMAVNTPKQEATTSSAPYARVSKRERSESMYDVKKRSAMKLKQENGGVTPVHKRIRKSTSIATPTMQRAIANTRRRSMNGPKPVNFASPAPTTNIYGSPNIGSMTAPGNFYQPSAPGFPPPLGRIPEDRTMHSPSGLAALANPPPSLSTYNSSPYGIRNSSPALISNLQGYVNAGSEDAPLAMEYPPLPSSVSNNALSFNSDHSFNKPTFRNPLSKLATYPAVDLILGLDSNLGARSSVGHMGMRQQTVSKLENTARPASLYGWQPVQQSVQHGGIPAANYSQQSQTQAMQPPLTPQSNTQVTISQPQKSPEISSNLLDYNLGGLPGHSSQYEIEGTNFDFEDTSFNGFMTDLYGAPDASSNESFNPNTPFAPPHGEDG